MCITIYDCRNFKFDNVDNDLLRRYFENSISFQEKEIVDQWVMDSENETFLLQFIEQSYLNEKGRLPVASFESLLLEIENRNNTPAKIISLNKKKWLWTAAAACLVFLLAGGWLGYFFESSKPTQNYGDVWLMNTTSNSNAQYAQLILDDGSEIYLGKNSEISVTHKSGINPVVYLEGEAYFNLKHGGKTLTVKTKNLVTTANDSKFNITSFKKNSTVTVSVAKGKAEVSENKDVMPMMELYFPQKDSARNDSIIKVRKTIPWTKIKPAVSIYENEEMIYDTNNKSTDLKKISPKVIPLIDLVPARKRVNNINN